MQFPESWLRAFCNPPLNTQQLADTLTMAGLEVEELQPVCPPFSGVVVARILEVTPHPNADRLRVCKVDAGQPDEHLTIVCGAPNAREGLLIPCARVGASLPPGDDGQAFHIKLGKLRGIESQGMLCSARELKLSDESAGLFELPDDAPVGMDIREYLALDDTMFTLKLTPNLAHCLSVYGVARELSALTGAPLVAPSPQAVMPVHQERVSVDIRATDLCGRFSGRVIRGIDPSAKTPRWMVDRLARCGQRSVNALVDISNYVMFELGRPTHIFDLDKLNGQLIVRWAQKGETLKLLNGNVVELDERVGVIADEHSVESLAGIMGGDATAVSDDTRNVYVEAAFWWPKAVAGRSRRYNFSTDAGHRFERGVDPEGTVEHIEYITQLIQSVCGGQAGPVDDQQPNMPKTQSVNLRVDRAAKVIGMPLTALQCINALRGLGLTVDVVGVDILKVTAPSYRFDIQIEEDLIEEVARVIGYENLPTEPPKAPVTPKLRAESSRPVHGVRRALASLGYQETINYSFVDEAWEATLLGNQNAIRLLNPIASQMNVMRSSLMPSLLNVAKFNIDRKADRVCAFEIGRVFHRDSAIPDSDTTVAGYHQPQRIGGVAFGPVSTLSWEGKAATVDFFDVKGQLESLLQPAQLSFEPCVHPMLHPGRCARVMLNGMAVGVLGELHPKWRQSWGFPTAPVLFELELDAVLARSVPAYRSFSKFQAVERDIAVWVAETVTHGELQACIADAPTQGVLQSATLFDIYRPASSAAGDVAEKSCAIRLIIQRDDAGLAEAEIDAAVNSVVAHLGTKLGARIRS